jgi:sulfotransferase family protein
MNPYFFIVGCPRSGTTLIRHILTAHPQIAVTPESHWIPVWFEERRGLTREGMVTPALIDQLLGHARFARLRIGREKLARLMANGPPLCYSAFVTAILDLYGKRKHKPLVGDKTPQYVRHMRTLHSLWPGARFIHLIRDGRDVRLSVANWSKTSQTRLACLSTWKDDPVSTTALWWESNVRLGRESGKSLGPGLYYEVRYERLISRPQEECSALCAFLGVPYDETMLRFHVNKKSDVASSAKDTWLPWRPVTRGLRDWRTQMPAGDVERFEAAVGELLDELEYERAVLCPRHEYLTSASRIRDLMARGRATGMGRNE